MCGIAGTVGGLDKHLLKSMMAALEHRGPDGAGYDICDPIQLAACRLAIIDVTGGAKPIYDGTRQRSIVFNGEIYNHIALRHELKRVATRSARNQTPRSYCISMRNSDQSASTIPTACMPSRSETARVSG